MGRWDPDGWGLGLCILRSRLCVQLPNQAVPSPRASVTRKGGARLQTTRKEDPDCISGRMLYE